ncbi:MAG: Fic/DOC family N-terminal domain-containing protein [Candidatus Altiarchaeota archaeon]|nr:Fic/DOC family N-terminal domain-containing protein [Candidatus Altiarchaeota archaeon]
MKPSAFDNPNGEFKSIEKGKFKGKLTFVPNKIPTNLENIYDSKISTLLSKADLKLGELNGCGQNDPNIDFLVFPYVNLEAVYSSQIEGTQTSISDFYRFEAEKNGAALPDQQEVRNYVNAMLYGFKRLEEENQIDLNLVKKLHEMLLKKRINILGVPGEIRDRQNWIAPLNVPIELATYVPPKADELKGLLLDWELFVQKDHEIPVLLQTALIHYQFEAIHPFLDGNGRIGRLLLSLFLAQRGCLKHPILFLSFYFQKNRSEYYERLLKVSQSSDWRGWFTFFLNGVIQQANNSIRLSRRINELWDSYHMKIRKKKVTASTIKLLDSLFKDNPVIYTSQVAEDLGIHLMTAKKAILILERQGILKKSKTKKPIYYYAHEILDTLQNP